MLVQALDMDQVTLTPQRVAAKQQYSKQLILQGGSEVDNLISNELAAAMNAYVSIQHGFAAIMASTAVNQTSVVTADDALDATTIVNDIWKRDALACRRCETLQALHML